MGLRVGDDSVGREGWLLVRRIELVFVKMVMDDEDESYGV